MITSDELTAILIADGLLSENIIVSDRAYSLPDAQYIKALGSRFGRELFNAGVGYVPERFDCDKFAKLAAAHAMLEHAMFSKLQTGLAFGVAYVLVGLSGHAINVAVHLEGGQHIVRYYEPQPEAAGDSFCLCEYPRDQFSPLRALF